MFALDGQHPHDLHRSIRPSSEKEAAGLESAAREQTEALDRMAPDLFQNSVRTCDLSIQRRVSPPKMVRSYRRLMGCCHFESASQPTIVLRSAALYDTSPWN